MADPGSITPAVGIYGYLTILTIIVLATLAAIILLMIVRKDPRPGEVYIRIFYGLIVRIRVGQMDEQVSEDKAAEMPSKNIPAWKRLLHMIMKRGG
jgi:hypothetical protein